MKDYIIRQAYDKGYDAGAADRAAGKPANLTRNPYKPTTWGNGRDDLWNRGYRDGYEDRTRKPTHDEHYRQLYAFRKAVLVAFVAHRLSCSCTGISHDADCPLGPLEVEAEAIRAERAQDGGAA